MKLTNDLQDIHNSRGLFLSAWKSYRLHIGLFWYIGVIRVIGVVLTRLKTRDIFKKNI